MFLVFCALLWIINSACSESQCGNYTNLTETTLRTDNSNPRHVPIPVGWYRYTGTDAGIMATSCPKGNNQCGAKQQVWIKGGLPAVSTGPVDVDACIRIENPNGEPLCCDLQNTICVENCGVFYIFLFRPLRGDTNFCFNNTAIKLTTTSISRTSKLTSTPTTKTTQSTLTSRAPTSSKATLGTPTIGIHTTNARSVSVTSLTTKATQTRENTFLAERQTPSQSTFPMVISESTSTLLITTSKSEPITAEIIEASSTQQTDSQLSDTTTPKKSEQRTVTPDFAVEKSTNWSENSSSESRNNILLGAYIGGAVVLTVITIVLLFIGIRQYVTSRHAKSIKLAPNVHVEESNARSSFSDVRVIFESSENFIQMQNINPRTFYDSSCASK